MNNLVLVNALRDVGDDGSPAFDRNQSFWLNPNHILTASPYAIDSRNGTRYIYTNIRMPTSNHTITIKFEEFEAWYKTITRPVPPNLRSGGNI